jgi:hypothetical protein
MRTTNHTPKDLAQKVYSELQRRTSTYPSLKALVDLFETMYFASLRAEEMQPIIFHVAYLDPDNPDPSPPPLVRRHRWNYVPLAEPITMTISNMVKIAKASDPRTSSFSVYHNKSGNLLVYGLIDQGNPYHDYVNYDSEVGAFERPGIFHASIIGIGHLVAYLGFDKIAELKIDSLLTKTLDVLWNGPVRKALDLGIQSYIKSSLSKLSKEELLGVPDYEERCTYFWITTLCRLLRRVQDYRHGGAILITPDRELLGLNIKYKTHYPRLHSALDAYALLNIQLRHLNNLVHKDDVSPLVNEWLENRTIKKRDSDDAWKEIDGTIWFISLLTRVDGLVLMNPMLIVQGFGVEITIDTELPNVYVSSTVRATKASLNEIDYNHYGTRHRSMMRYCMQVPDSVGFVVSQDGGVKVMTRVNEKLVMWENIKIHAYNFLPPRGSIGTS